MDELQPTAADRRLYTASQVRELDRCAIEEQEIPGQVLMERAGKSAFDAIRQQFPDLDHWLVVCGGGNNGGDGYIVARLARESGIDCRLAALKAPADLRGDAASAAQRWLDAGGVAESGLTNDLAGIELVVDALLGTGLDRTPAGKFAHAIASINACEARVAAIDIPSGLNADTGCALGRIAVSADMTVTFIGAKRGLFTADGPDCAGTIHFDSLDVPQAVYEKVEDWGQLIRENLIGQKLEPRRKNSHKGHYGWLLGIGGDRGFSGALRLAGEAALRSGAGKVTLMTHPDQAATLNIGCPELMVRDAEDGEAVKALMDEIDAAVFGPGLGQSDWSRSVFEAFEYCKKPLVVDADALTLVAQKNALATIEIPDREAVITPHPAEAGRLLGVSTSDIQQDRVSAALELARRAGCVTVLKGCGTVVAAADGRYAICPLGNPGMASAGTGDVLAGVIGALLAQGLNAWTAARVGVVAHAAAGDAAATRLGERGLMATDIVQLLPLVLNPN